MKPETKLWHDVKKSLSNISWTRLENSSVLGTPDLLGYNTFGTFFTVELKVSSLTSINKLFFSPHQISFHLRHPQNSFILAKQGTFGPCHLFPGSSILSLVACGFKSKEACCLSLEACRLHLESLGA